MTTSQEENKNICEIPLATEGAQKLSHVMFVERPGLARTFATTFDIQITGITPDKIYFTGIDTAAALNAFERLIGAMAAGTFISEKLIKKTAKSLTQSPNSPAAQFVGAAANQNKPQSAAFRPKTDAQKQLADLIEANDLTFAVGPAGTGKTHVAVVKAVEALRAKTVKKILLARPAMETGEKIGFLPGDQNEKLAPYMRPLYDELDKTFGPGKYKKMIEDGTVEVVPVGFMRGRTFSDAFIILDEAQNTTREQMKMALTRIGEGSKMVVTGDPEQVDLPNKSDSGLKFAIDRLQGKSGVGLLTFKHAEIVRSRIVANITGALTIQEPRIESPKPS